LCCPGGAFQFVGLISPAGLPHAMPGPHCATCQAYEGRVMAKAPDEVLPPDVVPCKGFAMSDAFREWAVGEMRKEVLGQVRSAGLDRMAVLKARKGPTDPPGPPAQGRPK
jgi:hypothetical protein